MTFEKFAAIAAAHRPDVVVHAHGAFGGVPDVAVYFTREDGTHSKVYSTAEATLKSSTDWA